MEMRPGKVKEPRLRIAEALERMADALEKWVADSDILEAEVKEVPKKSKK